MIIISGELSFKPEIRMHALQAMKIMMKASQAEEGCIHYKFYADVEDTAKYFVYEEWESDAHLEAHRQTEHMKTWRATIADLLAKPVQVKVFNAEQK